MITKVFEELGYDENTKDWTGEPSSIYIDILNHSNNNGFVSLYNSREIVSQGFTNCFYSNNSIFNTKKFNKVLKILKKEILKFNIKWNTKIDKIVFKQEYGNIYKYKKYLKEIKKGIYIYEF